jgi:flagellar biosynthesis/type III secretory pathway chaperone
MSLSPSVYLYLLERSSLGNKLLAQFWKKIDIVIVRIEIPNIINNNIIRGAIKNTKFSIVNTFCILPLIICLLFFL